MKNNEIFVYDTEETFLYNFLDILKRSLQNFQKIFDKNPVSPWSMKHDFMKDAYAKHILQNFLEITEEISPKIQYVVDGITNNQAYVSG